MCVALLMYERAQEHSSGDSAGLPLAAALTTSYLDKLQRPLAPCRRPLRGERNERKARVDPQIEHVDLNPLN